MCSCSFKKKTTCWHYEVNVAVSSLKAGLCGIGAAGQCEQCRAGHGKHACVEWRHVGVAVLLYALAHLSDVGFYR